MPINDRDLQQRFERRQAGSAHRNQIASQQGFDKAAKPSPLGRFNWDRIPDALKMLNEFIFQKLSTTRDYSELAALANEIDENFHAGVLGVLIKRWTRRLPDSAGNFIPEYLGLQVVGTGSTQVEAEASYRAAKRLAEEAEDHDAPTVCTPTNPTGRPIKAHAVLRPVPKGFNVGYASRLADKIAKTYQNNPSNIGPIEVAGHALPLQPKSYLEESFFFVSRKQWNEWKELRKR